MHNNSPVINTTCIVFLAVAQVRNNLATPDNANAVTLICKPLKKLEWIFCPSQQAYTALFHCAYFTDWLAWVQGLLFISDNTSLLPHAKLLSQSLHLADDLIISNQESWPQKSHFQHTPCPPLICWPNLPCLQHYCPHFQDLRILALLFVRVTPWLAMVS